MSIATQPAGPIDALVDPARTDPGAEREFAAFEADPDHQIRFGLGGAKDIFLNLLVKRDRP